MIRKQVLRRGAYVAFLVAAGSCLFIWRDQLLRIWQTQAWTLAEAIVFMAVALVVQARNFIRFLDAPGDIRTWALCRVWAATALFNYVAPFQPGVALRAVYLARQGIRIRQTLLATWRQLCVSVWIAIGGVGASLLFIGGETLRVIAMAFLASFAILPLARRTLVHGLRRIRRPRLLVDRRELLIDALSGTDIRGVMGVVVQYVVGTALLWCVYRGFGAEIGPGHALLLACMVYVSSLLSVLPGNLGVLEAIYVFGGHGAGLTLAQSAALAILLRCAQVVSCVLVALAGPPLHLSRPEPITRLGG